MLKVLTMVDTNDADYELEETEITIEEWERLKDILNRVVLRDYGMGDACQYNPQDVWGLTDDEVDFVNSFMPSPEYGFHSVEFVELRKVEVKDLLV